MEFKEEEEEEQVIWGVLDVGGGVQGARGGGTGNLVGVGGRGGVQGGTGDFG